MAQWSLCSLRMLQPVLRSSSRERGARSKAGASNPSRIGSRDAVKIEFASSVSKRRRGVRATTKETGRNSSPRLLLLHRHSSTRHHLRLRCLLGFDTPHHRLHQAIPKFKFKRTTTTTTTTTRSHHHHHGHGGESGGEKNERVQQFQEKKIKNNQINFKMSHRRHSYPEA